MNDLYTLLDLYSLITGLLMHAYEVSFWLFIVGLPAKMLIRALRGKSPI